MKKYLILLPLLYSLAFAQQAQEGDSISVELAQIQALQLGPALLPRQHVVYLDYGALPVYWEGGWVVLATLGTINYEWELYERSDKLFSVSLRSGLGTLGDLYGPPLAITGLLGRKQHHLDVSLGAFVGIIEATGRWFDETNPYRFHSFNPVVWPILEAGYRYQRPEGGLLFRAKIGTAGLGVGLGWAF